MIATSASASRCAGRPLCLLFGRRTSIHSIGSTLIKRESIATETGLHAFRSVKLFYVIILASVAVTAPDVGNIEIVSKRSASGSNLAKAKARIDAAKASWVPDGQKVAVIVFLWQEVKCHIVILVGKGHKMKPVEFSGVDPIKLCDRKYSNKHLPG